MATDVGELENVLSHCSVAESLAQLALLGDCLSPEQPFVSFYVAAGALVMPALIDYARKQLDIASSAVAYLSLDANDSDPCGKLLAAFPKIKDIKEDKILVVADGFEKIVERVTLSSEVAEYSKLPTYGTYALARVGHDYDQNLQEEPPHATLPLWEAYRALGKRIYVLTTISGSLGPSIYEHAVKTAAQSQFKQKMIEVRET